MKSLIVCIGVIALALPAQRAAAQCCTAGNPASTNCNLAENGKGMLNLTLSYMSSFSDTYFRGTNRLEKTYLESNFDYSSLALSYGLSSDARVTADVGYFFDKAQRFVDADYTRYARGISDVTLGLSYTTFTSSDRLFDLIQTARVTIPVGEFNQEYDGVVLPIDFQPSSGNYRYSLGLILSKRFDNSPFSLVSVNSIELSQAIETRTTYHKYGNLYNLSVIGGYVIAPWIQGLLQLRFEMRDRALTGTIGQNDNRYSFIDASGGVTAFVSPQISLAAFSGWTLSLQYNLPFYKNAYGQEQLTNRHSILAFISRAIDFGGAAGEDADIDPDIGMATMELTVHGSCDMCKTRIEEAADAIARVHSSRWDSERQILAVHYADGMPDRLAIAKALAAVGHDTDTHKAPDDVYDSLPECCHYRK